MLELCFNENLGRELIYLNSYKRRNGEKYNDVLPLDFRLDCGCLTNGAFSEERFKYLKALSKDKWMGNKAFFRKKDWENAQSTLETVKNYNINSKEEILIWLELNPKAICDFLFLVSEMPNFNRIKIITLSNGEMYNIRLCENSEELYESSVSLTEQKYNYIVKKWNSLLEKDHLLRVYLNGEIVGVDEDFYDRFIYNNLPSGNFVALELMNSLTNANVCFGTKDFKIKRVCEILRSKNVEIIGWKPIIQSPLDLYEQIYCKK